MSSALNAGQPSTLKAAGYGRSMPETDASGNWPDNCAPRSPDEGEKRSGGRSTGTVVDAIALLSFRADVDDGTMGGGGGMFAARALREMA